MEMAAVVSRCGEDSWTHYQPWDSRMVVATQDKCWAHMCTWRAYTVHLEAMLAAYWVPSTGIPDVEEATGPRECPCVKDTAPHVLVVVNYTVRCDEG